jgi:dTDP-glucose 4,6-dehydratase
MKTLLITGSAGFVGAHTVRWFLEKTDWRIIGLDSFRHMGDAERLAHDEHYRIICHDLNAPVSHRTADRIGPVDYIINCASISHVDTSIADPVAVWESNTRLMGNILEYARSLPSLRAFIHCSTDEVFGPAEEGYAHREWDAITPSNPYAASKAAQDALASAYWRTYGLPVCVTHTMNMIGTLQDPEKFLPKIVSRVARGETVVIHGSPGSIGSRMYIDCRNLADAWLHILRHVTLARHSDGASRMTKFNIAGIEEIDNLQLAQRVATVMGKPLRFQYEDFHKTRPGHDRRYALDSSAIRASGWSPPIPLDQTLREVIEHVCGHHSWQEPLTNQPTPRANAPR